MFQISYDFTAQEYYVPPPFNLRNRCLAHKAHIFFSPNSWRTACISLPEIAISSLAYVVEAGDCAIVPASQEGETDGKLTFLISKFSVLNRRRSASVLLKTPL
jgi:hypothetical protein